LEWNNRKNNLASKLKILLVEDSRDDQALLLLALKRAGVESDLCRVETEPQMKAALESDEFHVILSDHSLASFDSHKALDVLHRSEKDIPFIIVSGGIEEELAISAMRKGAHDFVMKDNLGRLAPVIEREIKDAKLRKAHRRASRQLEQAQKMEALGQLTGGIAHDFNNLLTVVQGNAEILGMELGENHKQVQAIYRAAERGKGLIRRLMSFSEDKKSAAEIINCGENIDSQVDVLRRIIGQSVVLEASSGENIWNVEVDPSQLETAMLNLAINAKDAMPDGGTLSIHVENQLVADAGIPVNSSARPGEFVAIKIADSGFGMPDDILKRLFEPFFTTKSTGHGTGLGLNMVFDFVVNAAGFITVESIEGAGTTFRIYLPRAEQEKNKNTPPEKANISAVASTILVLEDDTDILHLVNGILSLEGYTVITASSGVEVEDKLAQNPHIDLMLSDVVIPGGKSGPEVVREVVKTRPGLKIVFMSGYTQDYDLQTGFEKHLTSIITKPFRNRELADEIKRMLDHSG
jgi:two-component system, cell cycle sensor histidine kinase and response regulator CckA